MRRTRVVLIGTIAIAALLGSGPAAAQNATVLIARVEGPITPVIADHLREGVERAERDGHSALVVELDTPGGLDTSMRVIVKEFFASDVPVVVYVAPSGARAASAGAIIAFAGHVAAMAPGTTIGAATPVDLQGGEIGDKIINDAAAYVEAIAEERGRDTEFAIDTVRKGRAAAAEEALEIGAVDLVVKDLRTLLREIDGRRVTTASGERTLHTDGAATVPLDMGFFASVRQRLADPNLAFVFMSLGTLAIIYELANPGMGFGGIIGAILLILGFFALSVLPVNVAGIVLLILAAGLLIAELFVPGVGVLAAGGTVSLFLAGLFLFRGSVAVNLAAVVPVAAAVGGLTVFAGRLAWRARMAPSATGSGQLVGRTATVHHADEAHGRVSIDGTWWTIRSASPLSESARVRVTKMEGLELLVEPADQGEEDGP